MKTIRVRREEEKVYGEAVSSPRKDVQTMLSGRRAESVLSQRGRPSDGDARVRLDRVMELRQQIEAGTYFVSARDVADSLLRRGRWPQQATTGYSA